MATGNLKQKIVALAVVAALLALAWWTGRIFFIGEPVVREFFSRFPFWLDAVLLVVLYVAASFAFFDVKDVLKVVSAVLFGMWWSTLLIWLAEMVNNVLLFHLSRRLGRAWLERRFGLRGEDVGWVTRLCGVKQIFVLRAVPLVPYRVLDLAYGLTAVPFRRYFLVSAVASPFRIFWLQALLATVGAAAFRPELAVKYFSANPVVVWMGAAYLVLAAGAFCFLGRRVK